MKLNELKTVVTGEYDLSEGVIPVHLTMTLERIINDGKVTNNVQHFIMAGLISMFKDGGPTNWPRDLNAYPMGTGSDILDAVKGLSPTESVEMAKWLLNSLQNPASFESNPYACSGPNPMDTAEWMRWVLKKQD
jgi:hypothetical protein